MYYQSFRLLGISNSEFQIFSTKEKYSKIGGIEMMKEKEENKNTNVHVGFGIYQKNHKFLFQVEFWHAIKTYIQHSGNIK